MDENENELSLVPTGYTKPTQANGLIEPFKNENAESEVKTARSELNKLKDLLKKGTHEIDGVSTQAKILQAKAHLEDTLTKHGIHLTEQGFTLCKQMASRGFDPTGGAREGYDLVLLPDHANALTEALKEHDAFVATDKGHEYADALHGHHRVKGGYSKVRHKLKLRDGQRRFQSTFTMESALDSEANNLLASHT